MSVETTFNLNRKYLNRLSIVCDKYALKRNQLLVRLLHRYFKKHVLPSRMFSCVSYQQRSPKKSWKITHISFPPVLFEMCCDVRKCCKISVSLLIALAIDLYLDIIEKELENKSPEEDIQFETDNYKQKYVCIYNNNHEMTNYHIYWNKKQRKKRRKT